MNRLTYYQLRIGGLTYFGFSILNQEIFSFGPTNTGHEYMKEHGMTLDNLSQVYTAGGVLRFASEHRFCIHPCRERT